MLADPLTKGMNPERMIESFKTGFLDLVPTDASRIAKMMKQKARAKTVEQDEAEE